MAGFLQRMALQNYISGGHVIIAETQHNGGTGVSPVQGVTGGTPVEGATGGTPVPLGYCIFKDQYLKRDDVGIIYHLNVIGATLVKAAFERAAYGCRLFSCWCAQDIQANWFWESIGFVPLAFRTGSRSKQRTHIFWQRRVREDDESTPYWFPSQTGNGAIGEDRIVLPIPPGTHWRDAKPLVLPGLPALESTAELPKTLPGGSLVRPRPHGEAQRLTAAQKAAIHRAQSKHLGGVPLGKKAVITGSGIKYVQRTDYVPELDAPEELAAPKKPKKPRAPRAKNDPNYIKAARELRDKFLEQVNCGQILIAGECAKYDVSRQLEGTRSVLNPGAHQTLRPMLDAA